MSDARDLATIRTAAAETLERQRPEIERLLASAKSDRRRRIRIVAVGIVLALAAIWALPVDNSVAVMVMIGLVAAAAFVAFHLLDFAPSKEAEVQNRIVHAICEAAGDTAHDPGAARFDPTPFRDVRLIRLGSASPSGTYPDCALSHHIEGVRHGHAFSFAAARTFTRKEKSRVIAFDGVLLRVSGARPTVGRVMILKNYGALSHAIGGLWEKRPQVKIDDAAFSAQHVVHADDEDEARTVVSPAFIRLLERAKRIVPGATLSVALNGGALFLAVERPQAFLWALHPARHDFELSRATSGAVGEVLLAHRMVDVLRADGGPLSP